MSDGLVLDRVEAGYGETVVLEGISLDLSPGGSGSERGPAAGPNGPSEQAYGR